MLHPDASPDASPVSAPEAYRPHAPWAGAHWQTIRNMITGVKTRLDNWPGERLFFETNDGTGDRLTAMLHHPDLTRPGPLVIMIHGLTGCEDSSYQRRMAKDLLLAGYSVLRLNLRGAGPGRPHARNHYHSGKTEDLRAVLNGLPQGLDKQGLACVGVSLGGNLLLKYMGEEGSTARFACAISISAPIDLMLTAKRFLAFGNKPYHRYLITRMKAEALAAPGLSKTDELTIKSIRNTFEFDDRLTGPLNGWSSATEYYQVNQAVGWLPGIGKPTLMIHALDDPWIPGHVYQRLDWSGMPMLTPHLTAKGGHVGFHTTDDGPPWHDRQTLSFLKHHLPV
ncbi:MAG: alpha/beta fold hydrolase [Alphaproteobacteria bacterium]